MPGEAVKRGVSDSSSPDSEKKKPRIICAFVIPKKNNRQCHFPARPGEKFCAQHINESTGSHVDNSKSRKRVACPKDPSHTVWEDNVKKHVKKCKTNGPDIPRNAAYYKENLNIPKETIELHIRHDGELPEDKEFDDKVTDKEVTDKELADKEVTDKEVTESSCIELVKALYKTISTIPLEHKVRTHQALDERIQDLGNKKHAVQQASLISLMDEYGVLDAANSVTVEFGCGRAELSHYVAKARLPSILHNSIRSSYLLIDRAGVKNKQDVRIVKDYLAKRSTTESIEHSTTFEPSVQRLRIDIKDLNLKDCNTIKDHQDAKVHVISKHLCGCATDLTLHCVMNSGLVESGRIGTVLIALCCRQLCSYETYPTAGKQWLADNGIYKPQFDIIRKLTSWAVCGQRPGMDDEAFRVREHIGLQCRRIIDHGRVLSMKSWGFDASLVEYIDKGVSLENCCIIATRAA